MGEIAEMMLDGTLCQRCGAIVDGQVPGFPRYCFDCMQDDLDEELASLEYDFNFNKMAIEKLTQEIIDCGTTKQKKAIIKTFYKLKDKVEKCNKHP